MSHAFADFADPADLADLVLMPSVIAERIALILADSARQRLNLLGRLSQHELSQSTPRCRTRGQRAFELSVEPFDSKSPQHHPQRFAKDSHTAMAGRNARIPDLEVRLARPA